METVPVSPCIGVVFSHKCIVMYRNVSYVYRDFLDTSLELSIQYLYSIESLLFDTRSIHTRYVLGAVGISILYRISIPFRYTLDTSRILYRNK